MVDLQDRLSAEDVELLARRLPNAKSVIPFHESVREKMDNDPESNRKACLDALLLQLPGVSARKVNKLDAYFVNDKMFACISRDGVGLRLHVNMARDLQFSRADVVPFQPDGVTATREWIQINRADPAEYQKDRDLFAASIEFVRAARSR